MSFSPPPTTKGVQQSEIIVAAAVRCLARDGYSASSIARIADEAGYDDNTRGLLEKVLAGAPDLDQLVGSGIIEEGYFDD